ncbi:MAG: chromosome segregation protein SMC [Nitrospirae bacterium]|nr:chromosome segregation protein SMC [Nitrospirota bacterium]
MKIVKLELIGFKSFGERTSFSMHAGVTCIVGPNGSGKSNVVDAFRWVLGEQSPKTLRGEKMEEVIFNGTSQTAPKGMAEVTLSISDINGGESNNGSAKPDVVEVTRRLYRSGESEYYINKTKIRLKDVRELFLDTGLEVKSYSILEQGRIAEILNAKPIERRFLIEEVAGVMKYKVRRSEAIAKLERARLNIDRVNDIVNEVKRSVGSLERQSNKAKRYKSLVAQLNTIELKIAKRDYEALNSAYKALDQQHADYTAKLSELNSQTSHNEALRQQHSATLREKRQALEKLLTAISAIEKQISGMEKDMAVKDSALSNIRSHIERLNSQETEYLQEQQEAIDRMDELSETEIELQRDIELIEAEYLIDKTKIDDIEKTFASIDVEIRDKNRMFYQISEQISTIRNELSTLQTHLGAVMQKKESSGTFVKSTTETLNKQESDIEDLQKDIEQSQVELALTNEKKQLLTTQTKTADLSIERLRKDIAVKRESIASDKARLKSLEEITANTLHEKDFSGHINIVATLSTTLETPERYETAIENALAHRIRGVILNTVEELKAAAAFIKQRSWERTALICLDLAGCSSPSSVTPYVSPSTNPSHVGRGTDGVAADETQKLHDGDVRALDVVRTGGAYETIVSSLLGDFIIVRDFDRAIELFKGSGSGLYKRYVTLDGDVLDHSGVLTTGKGTDVLRHLRNIRELKESLTVSAQALVDLEKNLTQAVSERDWLRSEQQDSNEQIASLDKEISIFRLNLKKLIEEKDRLVKKLHYMEIEAQQIENEIHTLHAAIKEKEVNQGELNVKKDETATYIQTLRDNLSSHKVKMETTRSSLTEKKIALNTKKERLKSIQKEASSLRRKAETIADKLASIAEESDTLTVKQQETVNDMEAGGQVLQRLSHEVAVLRERAVEERSVIEVQAHTLSENDRTLAQLKRDNDHVKERLNENDVQRMQHSMRMENIRTSISNIYGQDVVVLEIEPLVEGEDEMIGELKRKIVEMGTVNLASIEEYGELKTRYDFLISQQEDILKSIEELEQAISKINSTTRRMLTEAFYELNIKFNETFQNFFGGGKAELSLTDPSNILESGIDVIVQPPGKKLQNINLLSGGEKSLSALSLIFAGFLIKPTPLCILDEADAALDESNTRRFSDTLKTLSTNTQFIVITHNRATMEVADYIYGITNEVAGLSKVISMQLN